MQKCADFYPWPYLTGVRAPMIPVEMRTTEPESCYILGKTKVQQTMSQANRARTGENRPLHHQMVASDSFM